MFLLANPLSGVATTVGCWATLAAGAATVWAMRRKIPHITECPFIGCCFLRGGCHKHEPINLVVEVHEASNIPAGADVYFYVEAGRFDKKTGNASVEKGSKTAAIFERVDIHVRQMDPALTVSLWRTGPLTSTLLGELEIDVKEEIIEKKYPQLEWYTLKVDGKSTVKVQLSFHKLDLTPGTGESPLVQYALLKAAREASAKGQSTNVDFYSMDDHSKLKFLSRVLEGPLKIMGVADWNERYFKIIEGSQNRWAWRYWKSKEDMVAKKKHIDTIPFLSMVTVLPDTHNRQQFLVEYYAESHSKHHNSKKHQLYCARVDRDRNLWVDGLYEFIERLRQYLSENPTANDIHNFAADASISSSQQGPREHISVKEKRTLAGPLSKRQNPTSAVPRKAIPTSVQKMVEEAMAGYDEANDMDDVDVEDHQQEEHSTKQGLSDEKKSVFDESTFDSENLYLREDSTGGPI